MEITREQRKHWAEDPDNINFNNWLNPQVRVNDRLCLETLYETAKKWGIDKEYRHLNNGQQRMNVGKALRKVVPRHLWEK